MSLVFNMVGGGTTSSKDVYPAAAEISGSWLQIGLDVDRGVGEVLTVDLSSYQIREEAFMGAMLCGTWVDPGEYLPDLESPLPLVLSHNQNTGSEDIGTFGSFAVPVYGNDQYLLMRIFIGGLNGYVDKLLYCVVSSVSFSDDPGDVYKPILYIRPNPT